MSKDYGFQHDDIRTISDLLQNSYGHGFPIIKELIQNANDAGAEILSISLTNDGFPDAKHPLLKNHPSLLIYNDGNFTEKDNVNITCIRGDNKTNDSTVVGKYGLGMKSVFHLCDLFFYVSKVTDSDIPYIEARPLNPWFNSTTNRHNEWSEFNDDDASLLRKYYETIYNGEGFLLIIPLKLNLDEEHIINNCIYQNGKGEYFGPKNEFKEKIQQLLLILNATSEKKDLKTVNINLPEYIKEKISIDGIKNIVCFNQDSLPVAKKIVDQLIWPKNEKKPSDKTTCVLFRLPTKSGEKAKLTISYSVYLPLEQDEIFSINTKYNYILMLHGEFATDSGREKIHCYEDIAEIGIDFNNLSSKTVDQAYMHWNQFLAQQRLYPLIPEILNKGIKEEVIDTEDINELFSVNNSEFIEKHKYHEFITAKNNLARTFNNSNNSKINWELFDANNKVYFLPENDLGKNIYSFLKDSFLDKIKKDGKLVCVPPKEGIYFLKNNTNTETIQTIIEGFKDEIFKTDDGQAYLNKYISFIEHFDTTILHLFAERFIDNHHPELFHKYFKTILSANHELLYNFYDKYPELSIIPVVRVNNNSKEIIYCSINDINRWIKEKCIFYEDTQKFAELYNLLSNQIIYLLNKYNQYMRFSIGNADATFILDNIERLVDTVESIDFNKYQDEFSLLLGRISKEQFYRLPIHKIVGLPGYHRIPVDNSYRGTSKNNEKLFPKGFSFPKNKKIFIDTHTFQQVIDIENRYIPDLSRTERIRIFFEQKDSINNDEELEWIIENFDYNERDKLSEILKGKKWIPIKDNSDRKYINPEVIFSENIVNKGTIDYLKNTFKIHNIYTQSDIDSEIKEKIINTEILKNINTKQELLKNISEQIRHDYTIEFNIESADKLFSYTEILSEISSQKLYKLFSLLYKDKTFTRDNNDYKENIYNEIYKNLNLLPSKEDTYYLDCIKSINTMELNNNIIEIFNIWLKYLIMCNNFTTTLFKEFKFPNKLEKWQNPTEIIYDPEKNESNILSKNELYDSSNEILKEKKDKLKELYEEIPFDEKELLLSNTSSVKDIFAYFLKWLNNGINKKLLGFLLYILRDKFQETSFEKALLNTYDSGNIKTHLDYCKIITKGNWNYNLDIDKVFTEGTGFNINIYQVDEIKKMTLGGTHGSFFNNFNMDFRLKRTKYYDMTNNINIDIDILFKNNLQGINDSFLKSIVKYIMKNGYLQSEQQNYEKLYNKLLDSNAKYLKQTEKNLLDEIFYNIKSLALATHPLFEQTVGKYNESRLKEENDEKTIYIKEMQEIIINNKNAQDILRNAIINRLSISQYDKTSIPYELFQNADDAMAQRVEYEIKIIPNQCVFSIKTTNMKIEFSYFGREINRIYNEKTGNHYQYDLESMLSLNTSYKKGNVTGKYGLGFKSVYFVCDEPIIRSGDLHLRIIAGFYPEEESNVKLGDNETRIELNLKENNSDAILDNFKTNAYFQTVFGKYINIIRIDNDEYKWIPNQEPFVKGSNFLFETGVINNEDFLKLTIYSEKSNMLFKLNKDYTKVEPIENNSICKIWNTTPLGDDKTINFAINAGFIVDIGRKTVVKNEKNTNLIKTIGELLGNILAELYKEKGEIFVASIFDVIIPAIVRGDKVLKELPIYAVKSFSLAIKFLPTGHGSLFSYDKKPKLFYCPDKRDFEIENEKTFFPELNKFISKSGAIENAKLVTDSASRCWEKIYSSSDYISIKDIFILLDNLTDNKLTPEALENFIELMNNVKFKIDNKYTNLHLSFQIKLKIENWSTINGLLKQGQKLTDVASDKYKTESLNKLQEYVKNILYQNPNTGISFYVSDPNRLNKIYVWWKDKSNDEKLILINDYEKSLYPEWFKKEDLKLKPDTEDYNKAWFTLFAIAICQQRGWSSDSINNSFLKYLNDNLWFHKMIKHKSDNSEIEWMKIIKEYYKLNTTEQKWQEWIKLIPQFFIIRNDMEEWISLIQGLDNKKEEFELTTILKPNTDPSLGGSGIDLPALNRTLKIGLPFIIRELLRFKIIEPNNNIICHAFMPKERTAKIVMGESYDDKKQDKYKSSEIFKEINVKLNMEKYTFDGYYDIPMLIYKEEEDNEGIS